MAVIIKVKSPSASYQDLEFSCDVSETVLHLKQRITEQFPTKPSVTGQKLVYSGKILSDSDVLEKILRFEDECQKFTFHLVCAMPQRKSPEERPAQPEQSYPDGLRHRSTAGAGVTTATSDNAGVSSLDMDQMMREFSNQYSEAMASMTNNPSEADIAAMQQLYNQYMTLYMQYMQSQSFDQAPMFLQDQQPGAAAGGGDQGRGGGGEVVDGGVPNNPGMVMNAGAGAAAGQIQEAGGDRQRDLLDWVYVMTRVMLLVTVIYFHSSFLRLSFVAGIGFFVYFYQNRVRQMRLQRQRQLEQQQQRQRQQQQDQEEHDDDAADSSSDQEVDEEDVEIEEPAPSKLAVFMTFCTSLVSSIIPEQPQVI